MPRAVKLPDKYDRAQPSNFCRCVKCRDMDNDVGRIDQPAVCTGYGYWGGRDWKFGGRGPQYYGMELEMHAPTNRAWIIAHSYIGDAIAEVKPDTGMEVTSHPMSLAFFMRNYPWDMLRRLRTEGGCGGSPDTYGLHVHVNKDGFSSADHMYHWLAVIYASPREMTRLGGRSNTPSRYFTSLNLRDTRNRAEYWWAKEEVKALSHVAVTRATRRGSGLYLRDSDKDKLRAVDAKLASLTGRYSNGSAGAVAETRHQNTFEVRFPGSSLDDGQVKSVIQLVAGTVEYARQLTSDAHSFRDFSAWTKGRRRYRDLNEAIERKL